MQINESESVTVRERVGVAVNASNLAPECAASTVVAALGSAAMMRSGEIGPAGPRMQVNAFGAPVIDPRRRIAALLQRAKDGSDYSTLTFAVFLFAHWLRQRKECRGWRIRDGSAFVIRFSGAVISEWMHEHCAECGGQGRVLASEPGRNARTRICPNCEGHGRVLTRSRERARMLGMSVDSYRRHWEGRFKSAYSWLLDIEGSNIVALQSQLKHGNVRPSFSEVKR